MGQISKPTLQRLYLLTLIGGFSQGVYGHTRLQKVSARVEELAGPNPFEVSFHHYGQYSHVLSDTLEQLISMRYVSVAPMTGAEEGEDGNRYQLEGEQVYENAREILRGAFPSLVTAIDSAVSSYGYMKLHDLLQVSYKYLEDHQIERGQRIFSAEIEDWIELPDVDEDACEDLEVSLNPAFVQGMAQIAAGLQATPLRLERLQTLELHAPRA